MQVVGDADCLIAGTLAVSGASSDLLDLWEAGEFELVVCPQLIHEVRKTLLHARVGGKYGITVEEVDALVGRLSEEGLMFADPENPPRVVPQDPNDDYLVALALASDTRYLVTRDRHFEGIRVPVLRIMKPRQMLTEIHKT